MHCVCGTGSIVAGGYDCPAARCPASTSSTTSLRVGLHATISGGNRLGWSADGTLLVEQRGPSWGELVTRAHDAQL